MAFENDLKCINVRKAKLADPLASIVALVVALKI
jgi:hypothetical protein